MFGMECQEDDSKIKLGCYPKNKVKPSHAIRALAINSSSLTSNSVTPHSSILILTREERKAVKAYNLQIEQGRFMGIELARRNTIR